MGFLDSAPHRVSHLLVQIVTGTFFHICADLSKRSWFWDWDWGSSARFCNQYMVCVADIIWVTVKRFSHWWRRQLFWQHQRMVWTIFDTDQLGVMLKFDANIKKLPLTSRKHDDIMNMKTPWCVFCDFHWFLLTLHMACHLHPCRHQQCHVLDYLKRHWGKTNTAMCSVLMSPWLVDSDTHHQTDTLPPYMSVLCFLRFLQIFRAVWGGVEQPTDQCHSYLSCWTSPLAGLTSSVQQKPNFERERWCESPIQSQFSIW